MIGFDAADSRQHGPRQVACRPGGSQRPLRELVGIEHRAWNSQWSVR